MIKIKNLTLNRGNKNIFKELSLDIDTTKITSIIGPSGCGKTSLFLSLLGVITPKSGEITYKEETLFSNKELIPAQKRKFGVVFQDLALFPHMSVSENIAYGLDLPKEENQIEKMLKLFKLSEHKDKHPQHLSGGEKQRLALARSLAPNPDFLLLDETFSSLDPKLRKELRTEIKALLKSLNKGCLLISHNMEEVEDFSDTIIALDTTGKVIQNS